MSLKINQTDEALDDVIKISDYIAEQSSMNASDRFLAATKQAFSQLADMPGIGVRRDYGNPAYVNMRMWPMPGYRNYLIFYQTTDEELQILRVLHGARDLNQIFAPRDQEE